MLAISPTKWNVEYCKIKIAALGVGETVVTPSPVMGSPYDYIEVDLADTDRRILISEESEWGPGNGLLVGLHSKSHPEQVGKIKTCSTLDEALAEVKRLGEKYGVDGPQEEDDSELEEGDDGSKTPG